MSKAVYLSTKYGKVKDADMPAGGIWPIQRLSIAEKFGWTLEYIDELSEFEIATILGIWDGESKA